MNTMLNGARPQVRQNPRSSLTLHAAPSGAQPDRATPSGSTISRLRTTALGLLGLALSASLSGCSDGPGGRDPYLNADVGPERLRNIDVLDFKTLQPASIIEQTEAATTDRGTPMTVPGADAPVLSIEEVNELISRAAPGADAATQATLNIETCRALALQNNLDLQVQLISPLIAATSITEEEARFEAALVGNVGFTKTDTPTSTTLAGSQVEAWDTSAGLRIPLRTGGEINVTIPTSSVETNNQFSTLNPAYSADTVASISQPLLRGAGVRTNTHAIRIARYQTGISEARTRLEVIRVLASVDRVYWRLYAARQALEVRRAEYELALAQLERARRRVDAGDAPEVEVLRAEAGVAERLEGIILADNFLRDRERDLKRIMNSATLEMDGPTVVIPDTLPRPVPFEVDAQPLIQVALDQRMEMLELELQLASEASSVDFARNQALPFLAVEYTYNINGLGSTYNDAFDLMFDKSFEDHRVGLRLEVPLGNEAAEARLHRAILSRLQTLATVELREAQISQEVLNAVDQLESNWQRVVAASRSVMLAARTLEAEQRQFDLGLLTSTDVLDAQARLAAARLSEIEALAEYEIARVDLAFATGLVLGATSVRWEPRTPEDLERELEARQEPPAAG